MSTQLQRGTAWPRVMSLLVALMAAVAVHMSWFLFVNTATGQAIDRAAFDSVQLHTSAFWPFASTVLNVVSMGLVAVGAITAVGIAIVRRRWLVAVQAALIIGGANLTTQVIKSYYYRPRLLPGWTGQNSLPSGHTTVAASVSIAVLFAVPRRWRAPVAVFGACWTLLMGLSTFVGQWHRPADVVAALLVVCAWGAGVNVVYGHGSRDTAGANALAVAVTLGAIAAVASVYAISAAWYLASASAVLGGRSFIAYSGGVAAIVASVCGVFALLLWLRQVALAPVTLPSSPFVLECEGNEP